MKKIIITGAQFGNKGAQALLFCFVSSIRDMLPECEIDYFPLDYYYPYKKNDYKFNIIYNDPIAHKFENGGLDRIYAVFKALLKKVLQGKGPSLSELSELGKSYSTADLLVDLSGYQLASSWSKKTNLNYLWYIQTANKHNVPVILFPQSFGPFHYGKSQKKKDRLKKNTLEKVKVIYERKKNGADLLKQKYNLKNVYVSTDFVLQSGEPKFENIYNISKKIENQPNVIKRPNIKRIGIVPNYQNFRHGDGENVINLYKYIIDELLRLGNEVIIFRHSEDLDICKIIYSNYKNNPRVIIEETDFSCFTYSKYIEQFDFLVAARYHAIVNGYKKGIPSIVLGWAEKYKSLTDLFNQNNYIINTNEIYNQSYIKNVVNNMNSNYKNEQQIIMNKYNKIRSNCCIETAITYIKKNG